MTATSPLASSSFADAFPNSRKVMVAGPANVAVPMREIRLADSPGGTPNAPVRVYDTSGPQGHDVLEGLPPIRDAWIRSRSVVELPDRDQALGVEMPAGLRRPVLRGTGGLTQLHYARRGEATPEMEYIAVREGIDVGTVMSEVARGRAIIPANINHPELEPMIIGRALSCEDQREYRQLRRGVIDRGGSREVAVGNTLGRRYRDGPVHR